MGGVECDITSNLYALGMGVRQVLPDVVDDG